MAPRCSAGSVGEPTVSYGFSREAHTNYVLRNMRVFEMRLIAIALTCATLLVSVLDESMCGADEQAQIHSDPELPM